ncbi:electron transport complex subunit RsxE, partial [Vibrio sp. 2128(2023)]|nr:electron transport complex subunit RsxE [Vibrio sp. 2128(2023)]
LGPLTALKNAIDSSIQARQPKEEKPAIERARVTNA